MLLIEIIRCDHVQLLLLILRVVVLLLLILVVILLKLLLLLLLISVLIVIWLVKFAHINKLVNVPSIVKLHKLLANLRIVAAI